MNEFLQKAWKWTGRLAFYGGWPFIWLYVRRTVRTRVIIQAEGKVLLVKGWLSPGQYSLPGGGLRRTEETEAGAVREVYEETGIKLDPKALKELGQANAVENGITFTAALFRYAAPKCYELRQRKFAVSTAVWFPISQIQKNPEVNSFTKQAVQMREV